ncbi:hypothetical protein K2173_007958 [Erythroxylum novogranatense]|uniref:DUF7870 domain-containing protein n=1 Tax=Erythroxylum novogranatense TaxID=1862640 RepID=A0AAV8T874_9ROSI|nr:hypothetical protein K2173_007958 [Erythroxylum novogranatense]
MAFKRMDDFQQKPFEQRKLLVLHANFVDHLDDEKLIDCSWTLTVVARAMLLALVFVSLPSIKNLFGASQSQALIEPYNDFSVNFSLVLHDLTNEGLFKGGGKAILVSNGDGDKSGIYTFGILTDTDMDHVSVTDSHRQTMIPDESFDFAFSYSYHSAPEFIDRTLKVGGIAIVQLSDNPSFPFNKPSNYKIIYLRRFQSATQRRLLDHSTEARKQALNNLEDVLLEPPRAASGKSTRYLKRTKYLPDLMDDSLESYPRRLFIDVGLPEKGGGSIPGWFEKHYPTRNMDFEVYKVEIATEESLSAQVEEVQMSDWLRKNVKEEDYVVVKAEAEVVEEMVKSKASKLVDELFLECKPKGKSNGSKRAYWECLALYGRLRDEGIAVHQWWG